MRSPTLSRTVRSNCRSSAAWPEELTTWQWKPWAAISRARRARRSGLRPVRRTASGIRRRYSPPSSRHTGWPTVRPIRSQQAISTAARSGGAAERLQRVQLLDVEDAATGQHRQEQRRGGPTTRPPARPRPPLPSPPAPRRCASRTSSDRTGCAAALQPTSTRWNSRSLIFMGTPLRIRGRRGRRKPISSRQERARLDRGVETLLQQGDALLDDGFRRTGPGRDQHRFVAGEPGQVDVGRAVDQVRRPAAAGRANSASRRLFELLWLPTTNTTSACRDKRPHGLLAVLRGIADVFLLRRDDLRETAPSALR